MQFVICDDSEDNLLELERMLLQYNARVPGLSFEIEKFTDAALLLHKIQSQEPADVYILDIVMSDISGIDLGREIRKKCEKCIIIYITASDRFALDAYDILAIRYLLKPVEEKRFFEAMDYALSHIRNKNEPIFSVKTKNGLEAVPYCEIEYIENSARKLDIHLAGGDRITSIYIRKSFEEEVKELLEAKNFLCVHKSFIVNLDYVRRLCQNNVIMNSGISIPVSRKSTYQVKKNYLLYISDQYK